MPRQTKQQRIEELEEQLALWQQTARDLTAENRELRDELLALYRALDPYQLNQ